MVASGMVANSNGPLLAVLLLILNIVAQQPVRGRVRRGDETSGAAEAEATEAILDEADSAPGLWAYLGPGLGQTSTEPCD